MLALRTSSHSKVVAFIVVLAMILMYTFAFAGTAFAVVKYDLKVHIASTNPPGNPRGPIEIALTDDSLAVKVYYYTDNSQTVTKESISIIPFDPAAKNLNDNNFNFGLDDIPSDTANIISIWVDSFKGSPVFNDSTNINKRFISQSGQMLVVTLYNATSPATPGIALVKSVSTDSGVSWHDANTPNGPDLMKGTNPIYQFIITNTGDVTLGGIKLEDVGLGINETVADTLAPGAPTTITAAGVWAAGQQMNTAKATGYFEEDPYYDEDVAYYYGYDPLDPRPAIHIVKSVWDLQAEDWADANDMASAPEVLYGADVDFKFVITNTGNVTLSGIHLEDSVFNLSGILLPTELAPAATFAGLYTLTDVDGDHHNVVTVSAVYMQTMVDDDDEAYFKAVEGYTPRPAIDLEKLVSVDGGSSWLDADTAQGPSLLESGPDPQFKFIITNTGNVTLTSISLVDSDFSLSGLTLPTSLDPGATFSGIITAGWNSGQHSNTATASGISIYDDAFYMADSDFDLDDATPVTDTDMAHYYGTVPQGDDDDDDDTDTDTDTDTDDDNDIPDEPTPTGPVTPPAVIIPPEPTPLAPQTGQNSNIALLLGMMLASGAGLVAVTRRRKTAEDKTN